MSIFVKHDSSRFLPDSSTQANPESGYSPIIDQQLSLYDTPIPFLNRAILTFGDYSSKREELPEIKENAWRETFLKTEKGTIAVNQWLNVVSSDLVLESYARDFAFSMSS
tara:strand:- start:295 stop:624 length:330 start_codon:yes stop_codon:yes gene_type:complete